MRRLTTWSPVVVGIALLANAQAFAQTSSELRQDELVARPDTLRGEIDTTGDATTEQGPVWELAGGYGVLAFPDVRRGGWLGTAGVRVRKGLWIVAEVGRWGFETPDFPDLQWHEFLGGLRYERPFGRVTPFAQLLTGVDRPLIAVVDVVSLAESHEGEGLPKLRFWGASGWLVRAGGGVDVRLTGRAALRLAADYGSLTRRLYRSWRITPSLVVRIGR